MQQGQKEHIHKRIEMNFFYNAGLVA